MKDDPIIAELYRIREEYAKRFNYDIAAMAEHIRGRQKEHPERVVSFPPKRPRQRAAAQESPEKYEEG